jgi:Zn-dependent peptidase ImmA (M78 family)
MSFSKPLLERIAREFWSTVDQKHRETYDIVSAVNDTLTINLILIKNLSIKKMEDWLISIGKYENFGIDDRSLHGFLMIKNGNICMFVEESEDQSQQRFTVAHEVSHYLLDYQLPKERAILALGKEIEDVLNGNLPPTDTQLALSVIKGVNISPYTFMIEKNGNGSFFNWSNFNSENEADYLAMELLAPRARIVNETFSSIKRRSYSQFIRKSEEILISHYKIPPDIARHYASELAYSVTNGPSFLDKLGF